MFDYICVVLIDSLFMWNGSQIFRIDHLEAAGLKREKSNSSSNVIQGILLQLPNNSPACLLPCFLRP